MNNRDARMKKPYINKFFVSDWISEPTLMGCGYYLQGLWFKILCVMAQSPRYGYLCNQTGDGMNMDEIVETFDIGKKLFDGEAKDDKPMVMSAVKELIKRGICAVDEDGTLFCRRLVKDHAKHMQYKETSIRGGAGRPRRVDLLVKTISEGGMVISEDDAKGIRLMYPRADWDKIAQEAVREHKQLPIVNVKKWLANKAKGTNELFVSIPTTEPEKTIQIPDELQTPDFKVAWIKWCGYSREIGKELTASTAKSQLSTLNHWGLDKAISAINLAVERGWRKLVHPDRLETKKYKSRDDIFSEAVTKCLEGLERGANPEIEEDKWKDMGRFKGKTVVQAAKELLAFRQSIKEKNNA